MTENTVDVIDNAHGIICHKCGGLAREAAPSWSYAYSPVAYFLAAQCDLSYSSAQDLSDGVLEVLHQQGTGFEVVQPNLAHRASKG